MTTSIELFLTPDDLLRMGDRSKGCELVDGRIVEKDAGAALRWIAGEIFARLSDQDNRGGGWAPASPRIFTSRCGKGITIPCSRQIVQTMRLRSARTRFEHPSVNAYRSTFPVEPSQRPARWHGSPCPGRTT